MMLVADTHVHIYPCYDQEKAIGYGIRNLSALQKAAGGAACEKALFLAERSDCDYWSVVKQKGELSDGGVKLKIEGSDDYIWIFPGRQVVTKEKIEVLSLLCEEEIPEGDPLDSTISKVIDAGGLPTLCWAPGKWLGERGRLVRKILEEDLGAMVFLADSAMRCFPIAEPGVFNAGRPVFAGSDPLPVPGEERMIGSYGVFAPVEFDGLYSLRENLKRAGSVRRVGERCSPFVALSRYVRNEYSRPRLS